MMVVGGDGGGATHEQLQAGIGERRAALLEPPLHVRPLGAHKRVVVRPAPTSIDDHTEQSVCLRAHLRRQMAHATEHRLVEDVERLGQALDDRRRHRPADGIAILMWEDGCVVLAVRAVLQPDAKRAPFRLVLRRGAVN